MTQGATRPLGTDLGMRWVKHPSQPGVLVNLVAVIDGLRDPTRLTAQDDFANRQLAADMLEGWRDQ